MLQSITVSELWRRNSKRPWIHHLVDCYNSGHGKDFETIQYWILQFGLGETSTLTVDRNYTILDGHHRLVAIKIRNLEEIQINVCPQRCTYGR